MVDIRSLLRYFNGCLEEERAGNENAKEVTVDRQRLIDLLGEMDAMLVVQSARNRPPR